MRHTDESAAMGYHPGLQAHSSPSPQCLWSESLNDNGTWMPPSTAEVQFAVTFQIKIANVPPRCWALGFRGIRREILVL